MIIFVMFLMQVGYSLNFKMQNQYRLTGTDLFPGLGFNPVLKLNKQCKIDLTPIQMKKIDSNLIQLIQKMLEKDHQKRISASSCLKDYFLIMVIIKK
ncbi:unnamed protein product [Paramecium sonneborni]|uniref:Protein kinase domain-containing protein n=1 Tax=Paramecium sonneborni TaxID=65129 RepID=A0A8S1RMI3_9CILI|nr:unnamed protein product [Paramecium sonneborni]